MSISGRQRERYVVGLTVETSVTGGDPSRAQTDHRGLLPAETCLGVRC